MNNRKNLILFIFVLIAILLASCNQSVSIDDVYETQSYAAFRVDNTLYKTLAEAVKAISLRGGVKSADAKSKLPTIHLMHDVSDPGAVIETDVLLDFGQHVYTLSASKTGIEIKEGSSVNVSGGVFKASKNNESLDSLFKSNGYLTLSGITVELSNTSLNAIETSKGKTIISGKTSMVVGRNNNIIVAEGLSAVSVSEDSDVYLWGSLSLSGEAEVFLSNSSLTLTKEMAIEGGASFDIQEPIKVAPPVFYSQPKTLNIAPGGNIELNSFVENNGFSVEYQWYESADGTKDTGVLLDSKTSPTLDVLLPEAGIKYYYCVAKSKRTNEDSTFTTSDESISNVASVAYTGLPAVYVKTKDMTPVTSKDSWMKKAKIAVLGADDSSWDFESVETSIKGRGNSTWSAPKKPYAIKLKNAQTIMGMQVEESNRWVLLADYYDKSLLRNLLASIIANDIFGSAAWWNPTFRSVDLILNDEYIGTYSFGEQIRIDGKRINISEPTQKGFIAEINARLDEDYNFTTKRGVPISLKDYHDDYEKEPMLSLFGNEAKDLIQNMEDTIFSGSYNDIKTMIDVDSFINWYLVNEIAKNRDAQSFSSIYLYYNPTDEKIHLGPCWDFDIGFGNDGETNCGSFEGLFIYFGVWINKLMDYPEFKTAVAERFESKYEALLTLVNDWIQEEANKKMISAQMNFSLYNELGQAIWPYAPGYNTRTTYQAEVDYLIEWTRNRLNWLHAEFSSWLPTCE